MKYVAIVFIYLWACSACQKAKAPPAPAPQPEVRVPGKAVYTYLIFDSTYVYQKPDTGLGSPETIIKNFPVSRALTLTVDSAIGIAYCGVDSFKTYDALVTRFFADKAKMIPECIRQELRISQDSVFIQRVLLDNGAYPSNCVLTGYRQ